MKLRYTDLEWAFQMAGSTFDDVQVIICRKTGRILTDYEGAEDAEDFPNEPDCEHYAFVPDQRDLDLGSQLVFRFANTQSAAFAEEVRQTFGRKGAYQRYNNILARHDLIDAWHAYRDEAETSAFLEWAKSEGFEVTDVPDR